MAKTNVLQSSEIPTPPQPVVQIINRKTIPAGIIGPRQLRAGYAMIKVGLAANRPETTNEIVFWFSIDTLIMSYFDTDTNTWKSGVAFS